MADRKKKILLDPGHEYEEPGSTQADGESEAQFTLALARATRAELLAGYDCEVCLTHEGAGVVPGGDLGAELRERSRMADRLKADYFLSIHHNAGPQAAEGAEWYIHTNMRRVGDRITRYHRGAGDLAWLDAEAINPEDGRPNHEAPRSLAAARVIVPIVADALAAQGIKWRGRPGRIMCADFAVLRYCSVPCGLIETHFGTNPREDEIADRPEFILAIAQALALGIATYLQLPRRAPARPPNYVEVTLPPAPDDPMGLPRVVDGELRDGETWIKDDKGNPVRLRAVAWLGGRRTRWTPAQGDQPARAVAE